MMKMNSYFGTLQKKKKSSSLKYHGKDLKNLKRLGRNLLFTRNVFNVMLVG